MVVWQQLYYLKHIVTQLSEQFPDVEIFSFLEETTEPMRK